MKYLNIKMVFLSLIVVACGRNSQPIFIADSVSLDEWNTATMLVMTEKLHLDSFLSVYWGKNNPSFVSMDNKPVNNFREEIQSFLSFRKKILPILKKESCMLQNKPFYIVENQGFTFAGFMRSFTIVSDTTEGYHYKYNSEKDCFLRKKMVGPYDFEKQPLYHSEIDETGVMTGVHIVTLFYMDTNNKLFYKILELSVW